MPLRPGRKFPKGLSEETSVGLGGLPDRDGHVTLDACIMDENGRCGSVAFLEHIVHPISVARMVMEKNATLCWWERRRTPVRVGQWF